MYCCGNTKGSADMNCVLNASISACMKLVHFIVTLSRTYNTAELRSWAYFTWSIINLKITKKLKWRLAEEDLLHAHLNSFVSHHFPGAKSYQHNASQAQFLR